MDILFEMPHNFTFVFGFSSDSDNFLGKISAIIDNLFVDGSDHLEGAPGFNDTAHSHGPGPLSLGRVAHDVTRVSVNRRSLSLMGENTKTVTRRGFLKCLLFCSAYFFNI